MKKQLLLCFMIIGVLFISCEKEIVDNQKNETVSNEVLQKIQSMELNSNTVEFTKIMLPDGSSKQVYLVEGCIAIDPEYLNEMDLYGGIESEQYRTYNLVSYPRTISIIGYTGGTQALTTKMRNGLTMAVNNYNALNLGITFTLTFGTSYSTKDMVVYKTTGAAGGVAGFPSGGKPYKYIQIFSGTESYSQDVVEHVITHEMGHCVGLRHTDWATRQSCGQSGESANPDGAVHIPGTPTGYDANSIMLACFSSSEDGEFGSYDITALNYLY